MENVITKQLSVFLENRAGRINEVVSILADNDINMTAFSIADSPEFGIMRALVSDLDRAAEVLRRAGFRVNISQVVALDCPNVAGSLARILDVLAREEVFIEYMYAFSRGETASIVIRPDDLRACLDILSRHPELCTA